MQLRKLFAFKIFFKALVLALIICNQNAMFKNVFLGSFTHVFSPHRTQWTLCTRTWSEAVSYRRRCGHSKLVTVTCWRITCGGFPSGPVPVCWSWSSWPSPRSTRYADYSVTNTEFVRSRDDLEGRCWYTVCWNNGFCKWRHVETLRSKIISLKFML